VVAVVAVNLGPVGLSDCNSGSLFPAKPGAKPSWCIFAKGGFWCIYAKGAREIAQPPTLKGSPMDPGGERFQYTGRIMGLRGSLSVSPSALQRH
jgi:hypothetical protein